MKTSARLLWVLAVFYAVVTVVYTLWTHAALGHYEWVGIVTLALSGIFVAFVAFYLGSSAKPFRIHVLPEDRLDGEIADADPELGFFPPQSWWPFVLALAVGLIFLGISIGGWWFAYFSAPLFIIAIVGWVFEYYRGRYAH
ncbi:cytochrome c oxidase subunit 4 [Pseudoclavibacter helvolus]|uniref:Cytochrome c oxidase polypeptide 4 n=1 Tax=Pseudoclavibacter helvolus TaxID=255205 RepID=A0A7W4YF17_9MICO|nr:cytochrome c oxidase subunit 4 [Pseudoclavibacter helvolus]MBB2956420.1 hypothetical protein [Pseudoclavibacter helvolus]